MLKSASLERINGSESIAKIRNCAFIQNSSEINPYPKRRHNRSGNLFEQYCITIRPRLHRSNSLSDLTTFTSDFNFYKHTTRFLSRRVDKNSLHGSSGDSLHKYYTKEHTSVNKFMSWKFKGERIKRKAKMSPDTVYDSKYTVAYAQSYQSEPTEFISSGVENSSTWCSMEQTTSQKGVVFPFKSTPSGNLKVQSNQVVFQSSTVGVLLADPTHAKVKVKFEGKASDGPNDEIKRNLDYDMDDESDTQFKYGCTSHQQNKGYTDKNIKANHHSAREDKEKHLERLGYALSEPIDWMRVQLPTKQDLFQEFYRRVHNHINTDAVIHIGDQEFHCHYMVLQIYSLYFERNPYSDMELPIKNVTPKAFQTIYEWMIASGLESNQFLMRDNILDLFCAAQYLEIKDLEDQCWSFIVNDNLFNEDSAFFLFREAKLKGMTPVMDLMVPRVRRFFLPLVASRNFLELTAEETLTFLRSNYICVTSEIEVLMAAVRWLHADWTNRHHLAVELMRCVRFGLISPWQLVDIKRNPDNSELLEIVNQPEVQQMVDDGLAYVIIKYGNNSTNYDHWIDVLDLTEPAERNWIGEEKNHVTYKDFLKYLEQFMVPKDQMYQQMSMMQPTRRNEDLSGSMRVLDPDKKESRRPNIPLLPTLKGLSTDKSSTMSEYFNNRRNEGLMSPPPVRSPTLSRDIPPLTSGIRSPEIGKHHINDKQRDTLAQQKHLSQKQMFEPPEKDSDDLNTNSESSTVETPDMSITDKGPRDSTKRHSVAASFLATATAQLAGYRRNSNIASSAVQAQAERRQAAATVEPRQRNPLTSQNNFHSPQMSLFNHSKESLARLNMNKLSASILGPSNKKYLGDGSLFNGDRETVLVFGGIDPHTHTNVGVGKNTGKDIYRFDPVTNVWDNVGELPEPRHYHSVAFLRGRVYLVGGADPRDDDIRGKSVVVSTVWSYEPVTRSWYSENGLSIPRKNFGLVVHRMALYAIGGQDKKGRVLRSVERFDPQTGSWSEVRPMAVARMAVATVKYRDFIWVAGGMTGEKKRPVCSIVECYSSRTNEWTEIHNLRFPRCFASLFSINDKLFIVGGAGKISEKDKTASSVGAIDVWDWTERCWKQETEMSIPRHGHALAYLGTQLIIIGGMTTIYMRALNNVESYCCERRAWIRGVTSLPSPLSGHGAVTLPPASLM